MIMKQNKNSQLRVSHCLSSGELEFNREQKYSNAKKRDD